MDADQRNTKAPPPARKTRLHRTSRAFTNGYEALTCLAKLYSLQAFLRDLSAARRQQPTFACHRTHSMR